MEEVKVIVERVADADLPVLIRGETGTGKDLLARSLHACSSRRDGPFVTVNCAAISGELLESEPFGHKGGTFTGAWHARPGKFELAREGTIFLDNVGETDLSQQTRLLEVLHKECFLPLGGREGQKGARVIASTNRDLAGEVTRGRFREDLYRHFGIRILLPPLRERREEIPMLVDHFCQWYSQLYHRRSPRFSAQTLKLLEEYSWPGNIRELENAVQRAVILEDDRAAVWEILAQKDRDASRVR